MSEETASSIADGSDIDAPITLTEILIDVVRTELTGEIPYLTRRMRAKSLRLIKDPEATGEAVEAAEICMRIWLEYKNEKVVKLDPLVDALVFLGILAHKRQEWKLAEEVLALALRARCRGCASVEKLNATSRMQLCITHLIMSQVQSALEHDDAAALHCAAHISLKFELLGSRPPALSINIEEQTDDEPSVLWALFDDSWTAESFIRDAINFAPVLSDFGTTGGHPLKSNMNGWTRQYLLESLLVIVEGIRQGDRSVIEMRENETVNSNLLHEVSCDCLMALASLMTDRMKALASNNGDGEDSQTDDEAEMVAVSPSLPPELRSALAVEGEAPQKDHWHRRLAHATALAESEDAGEFQLTQAGFPVTTFQFANSNPRVWMYFPRIHQIVAERMREDVAEGSRSQQAMRLWPKTKSLIHTGKMRMKFATSATDHVTMCILEIEALECLGSSEFDVKPRLVQRMNELLHKMQTAGVRFRPEMRFLLLKLHELLWRSDDEEERRSAAAAGRFFVTLCFAAVTSNCSDPLAEKSLDETTSAEELVQLLAITLRLRVNKEAVQAVLDATERRLRLLRLSGDGSGEASFELLEEQLSLMRTLSASS